MSWFERLTGFREESPDQVRSNLRVEGNKLRSVVNGGEWTFGELEIPSLAELSDRAHSLMGRSGQLRLREVVADIQELHADPANAGALFQVASQFNLLEMVSPNATPEQGVGIYEYDRTQGPACAIACGAGTIYRNYFASVGGQLGQTQDRQIDCLAELGAALGSTAPPLWDMKNGYALASSSGLKRISEHLAACSDLEMEALRHCLRVGIQWQTQVTLRECSHLVTQAYCSALPVAYSSVPAILWADFAQLVLDAAYEATMCAAVLNAERTGNSRVFLTFLGGGAFGNDPQWIAAAIRRALDLFRSADLDVSIVSYRQPSRDAARLIQSCSS